MLYIKVSQRSLRSRLQSEMVIQCPLLILRSKPNIIHLRKSSTIGIGGVQWTFTVKLQNENSRDTAYISLVPQSSNSFHIRIEVTWKPESPAECSAVTVQFNRCYILPWNCAGYWCITQMPFNAWCTPFTAVADLYRTEVVTLLH
jgi:hypothetical protein